LLVALFLVALLAGQAASETGLDTLTRLQTVVVNDQCTGTFIGPRVVMTASHCVWTEGSTAEVRSGPVRFESRVVWDSAAHQERSIPRRGLDVALLLLPRRWPYFYRLVCFGDRPDPRDRFLSRSFSIGQEWWVSSPVLIRVVLDVELGEVAVWKSDQLPGASGSLIFSRETGCAVGMVTHGIVVREIILGAVGWRLREAAGAWPLVP